MAPIIHENDDGAATALVLATQKLSLATTELDRKFSQYRSVVPLLSNPNVLYLNSTFMPLSNLLVHQALTNFAHEALHNLSPKAAWLSAVKDTRELVARYLKTDSSTISFTRDTSEGLSYFIRSVPLQAGDNVVRLVPTIAEAERSGKVEAANAATFAPYVDDQTRVIGLSTIMFHSGQWNDVQDICSTYRPRGIHVLADLTQQARFTKVDVRAMGVSAAAFSLHKGLNCPTGFGALYVDQQVLEELNPTPATVTFASLASKRSDFLASEDPIELHNSARRYGHWNQNISASAAARAYLGFYLDTMGPKNVQDYLYRLGDELRKECKELGIQIVGARESKGACATSVYPGSKPASVV
ncbi:hypothetical protein NM208_g5650 [Fusarium decemcellulare]|uniref:Uncharacterized protein n=1 Tax=Fusarium decemcellulare TaxID=57161 RepID=A0ACC1SG89_9HYPO|nr:hypothetical protein NM208_g5650 [Fusarium decemcellulare]